MAGRFEGLSDLEWKLFEDIFPLQQERRKVYFDAFIDLATIHIWIHKILLVG